MSSRTHTLFVVALCGALTGACDQGSSDDDETEEAPRKKKRRRQRKKKTAPTASAPAPVPKGPHPGLKEPPMAVMKAPATFRARFDTTKGPVTFTCERSWAPHGADRFYSLVKIGFFDEVVFFRVVRGFAVQWGIHGDPAISKVWRNENLPVDPVVKSNTRGMVSFAMAGRPTSRTTQLFVNLGNNARLDKMGFAPVCEVTDGMEVVDNFFAGHGENVSRKQADIQREGNAYLRREWPGLDFIIKATVLP